MTAVGLWTRRMAETLLHPSDEFFLSTLSTNVAIAICIKSSKYRLQFEVDFLHSPIPPICSTRTNIFNVYIFTFRMCKARNVCDEYVCVYEYVYMCACTLFIYFYIYMTPPSTHTHAQNKRETEEREGDVCFFYFCFGPTW